MVHRLSLMLGVILSIRNDLFIWSEAFFMASVWLVSLLPRLPEVVWNFVCGLEGVVLLQNHKHSSWLYDHAVFLFLGGKLFCNCMHAGVMADCVGRCVWLGGPGNTDAPDYYKFRQLTC